MKSFIKANYNIIVNKIYKNNNKYFFYSNNEKIYLLKTEDKKDNIVELSNEIYNHNKRISTFIKNNEGKYFTKYDNHYIVLLKYNDLLNGKIEFNDIHIKELNNYLDEYKLIDYFKKEIDTIEKEIMEYNREFPLVQKSINYFIGVSENAIQLLDNVKINNNYLCHNIKINDFNLIEYNNPFNIIRTNYMFDYANYFKYKFYYEIIDYDELYYFIKNNNYNELIIFFGLMLYQKEYFDMVKEIFSENSKEEEINLYIDKIDQYKELLLYIRDNMGNISEIREIEWLDR